MNRIFIFILSTIILAQPPTPQALAELKRNAIQAKKMRLNINQFEKELRQGHTLEQNGMTEDAERIYKNILSNDPGYTRAFTKLRKLLKNQNRFDELIPIVDNYVNSRPKDSGVLIDQMEIYIWAENVNWIKFAEIILNVNLKNTNTLKSLMGRIISNGFLDEAQSYIEIIRSKTKQPDFYASELGTYFRTRMAFDKSLENFLLLLEFNPKNYQMVSSRIMSFPSDKSVVDRLREILNNSQVKSAKLLLSDLEFRAGNFQIAYNLLKIHYTKPGQLLQFAQHATNAKAYDIALSVFTDIIDGEFKVEVIRSALYGMAQTLEIQSIKTESLLPLITSFEITLEFFDLVQGLFCIPLG